MADPTNIVMERTPVGIRFTGDLLQGRGEYLAKYADYMPVLRTDHVRLQPVNGAPEVGRLLPVNILSSPPFGSLQDLYDWLDASFRSASSTTYTVLLADLQNGVAPAGQWVFVSDILDRGAYLFCASSTEVAKEGFGLFLNADFQGVGTYLASYSGNPCSQANYGQWRPEVGNFLINHGVVTGGYQAGEALSTATWTGIIVSDDGSTMTAYSTGGNSYPLAGETITGATLGGTCVQSGVAGLNQLTGGGVVVYQSSVDDPYYHYLAIDPSHINGADTPDRDPAYLLLDRSVASAGYLPVVDAIEYDINGTDSRTSKGWLIGRKNASHDIRLTEATANANWGGLSYSFIHTYPWGSDTVKGFRIDDGRFVAYNIGDLVIKNVHIGQGSQHTPTLGAGCTITNFTQDAGTTVEYTLNAGVGISNVHVNAGKSFTGKTFTANIGNFVATDDNTSSESLYYAPFTRTGQRQVMFDITSAQLINHLDAGGINGDPDRIPLLALSGTQYATGTIRYEFTYGSAPYTLVGHLCIYNTTGNQLSKDNGTTITGATDRGGIDTLNSPIAGQSVSFAFGESHWLGTTSAQNAFSGDGTLRVIYNIDIHEKMA